VVSHVLAFLRSRRFHRLAAFLLCAIVPVLSQCNKPSPSAQSRDATISPTPDAEQLFVTDWKSPAERLPLDLNFQLTGYDKKPLALRDLVGQPLAISFIYTRCNNWQKCPRVADTMNELHTRLTTDGLADRVKIILVTFDPAYDSPGVLSDYAKKRNLRLDRDFLLVQPRSDQVGRLFESLHVPVSFNDDGVSIHGIQLVLIDRHGRLARRYSVMIWDNKAVARDLKILTDEPVG
jgi:cytochrome oxidase Cu insertion factor (SCO1/SenC/PrrC family)